MKLLRSSVAGRRIMPLAARRPSHLYTTTSRISVIEAGKLRTCPQPEFPRSRPQRKLHQFLARNTDDKI